jgi:hypothetical protein
MGLGRPANNPVTHAAALWAINWCFALTQRATRLRMARRLGVMYVSYDRRIWAPAWRIRLATYVGDPAFAAAGRTVGPACRVFGHTHPPPEERRGQLAERNA